MELKHIKLRDYFKLPNSGLTAYLKRTLLGNSEEYRTKFYPGRNVLDICNSWSKTLERIARKYPGLLRFENHLLEKVGPLSIQKPLAERMDDVENYYDLINVKSVPISRSAINLTLKEYQSAKGLRLRTPAKTVQKMDLSKNSGSPFFTKKRHVIWQTINAKVTLEHQIIEGTSYSICAVIGWRGQEAGPNADDVKQRVVWMFPFVVNVHELTFYQVAIEAFQRLNLNPSWISNDAVDLCITKLFDTKSRNEYIMCTDFEKFDQHFNSDMSSCARDVISNLLTDNMDSRFWLDQIFPIKYNIGLLLTEDKMTFGLHGMGSGSGGTNFDESMTHRCLQHEAAFSANSTLNPYSICLGDDGILSYPGIDQDHVIKCYTSHGQDMNDTKQSFSQDECDYLRRWHSYDYRVHGVCVGVYSTYRALNRLCEQERFYDPEVWGPRTVALRQLSILENVKWHPLREEFAKFCMKGDKYRLGIDLPGFLDNIAAESKKITDIMPDFIGYNQTQMSSNTGIKDWWIVQYLKSLV